MIISAAVFGMFILFISLASSVAVSSRYWKDNPIIASPGEKVDFFVVLQNIAGEGGDVELQGLFNEGGNIAKFTSESDIYSVPFGEKVNVNISVIIPEDAIADDLINIIIAFKIIAEEGSDQFGLGSSIERNIPIKIIAAEIQEDSTPSSNYTYYYIAAIIALILIVAVYILIKKRK